MARLLKFQEALNEGEFFNSYLRRRLLEKNQNVLMSVTGGTGSGKTYSAMSIAENYYEKVLGKKFPVENIVFSLAGFVERLKYFRDNHMRGELLIPDEWGVNNSALDFQSKSQKMFTYIMQSFRSMNIGLIMTLPVLTMLNKSTRQLLHCHLITAGIDYDLKKAKLKAFFHQLNQMSGKSYWKYPKVRLNGRMIKLRNVKVSIPSDDLIGKYEKMKEDFVYSKLDEAHEEFKDKTNLQESKTQLTEIQQAIYDLSHKGYGIKEISEILGKAQNTISTHKKATIRKGYKFPARTGNVLEKVALMKIKPKIQND